MCFSYIESGPIITTNNPRPVKQPVGAVLVGVLVKFGWRAKIFWKRGRKGSMNLGIHILGER